MTNEIVIDRVKQMTQVSLDELIGMQGDLKALDKKDYKKFRKQLVTNGFTSPFIIWDDGGKKKLLDGHQRLRTLKMMDADGVQLPGFYPAVEILAEDEKKAKEILLGLAFQYGRASDESLSNFMVESGIDFSFLEQNISLPSDISLLVDPGSMPGAEGLTDEDEVPEVVEPKVKLGDIYQLGQHRLICGDSTDREQVTLLMTGEKADMAFTDPPYGVNYDGGIQFTKDGVKKGQRKKLDGDDSADIYSDVLPILATFVDGPIYTWYAASHGKQLYNAIDDLGEYHSMIVWVKDGGYGALNANYKQKHEPCVYWKPKGSTLRWSGPTTENTIWEMKKDKVNKLHPTQKPVELAERAISNHEAKSVLDLFGGSGSTLIACEKTKRKCYMMELDPHYCDVIIERWEKFTGLTAVKLN